VDNATGCWLADAGTESTLALKITASIVVQPH
jgi:hypothetical protein